MKKDRLEMLQSNGRLISVVILCVFILGFVYGATLLYAIGFFMIGLLAAALVIAWFGAHRLACRRELPTNAVFCGDPLTTKVHLHAQEQRWRMLEYVEIFHNTTTSTQTRRGMRIWLSGGDNGVAIDGEQHPGIRMGNGIGIEVTDVLRFPARGLYRLGSVTLSACDPLGLLRITRPQKAEDEVLVYPRPLQMGTLAISGNLGHMEETARSLSSRDEGREFRAVRPYVQGDDMRRIHWKATAHTGCLTVKEFDPLCDHAVQIMLDLRQDIYDGVGGQNALEVAITLATSLIYEACEAGVAVGLMTTGGQIGRFSPGMGQRHLFRMLEALALARADGAVSLAQVLASGEPRQRGRPAMLILTPDVNLDLIDILPEARRRTPSMLVVSLNAQSFHTTHMGATEKTRTAGRRKHAVQACVVDQHQVFMRAATHAGIEVLACTADQPLSALLEEARTRLLRHGRPEGRAGCQWSA